MRMTLILQPLLSNMKSLYRFMCSRNEKVGPKTSCVVIHMVGELSMIRFCSSPIGTFRLGVLEKVEVEPIMENIAFMHFHTHKPYIKRSSWPDPSYRYAPYKKKIEIS